MKICASCGASLPDGAVFCTICNSTEFRSEVMPNLNGPKKEKPKIEYDQYGRPIGQNYQQPEPAQPTVFPELTNMGYGSGYNNDYSNEYSQQFQQPQYIEQYSGYQQQNQYGGYQQQNQYGGYQQPNQYGGYQQQNQYGGYQQQNQYGGYQQQSQYSGYQQQNQYGGYQQQPAQPEYTGTYQQQPAQPEYTGTYQQQPAQSEYTEAYQQQPAQPEYTETYQQQPAQPEYTETYQQQPAQPEYTETYQQPSKPFSAESAPQQDNEPEEEEPEAPKAKPMENHSSFDSTKFVFKKKDDEEGEGEEGEEQKQENPTTLKGWIEKFQDTKDYTHNYDANDFAAHKTQCILAALGITFWVPYAFCSNSLSSRFYANQGLLTFIVELIFGSIYALFANIISIAFVENTFEGYRLSIAGWIIGFLVTVLCFAIPVFIVYTSITNIKAGKVKDIPFIGKIRLVR